MILKCEKPLAGFTVGEEYKAESTKIGLIIIYDDNYTQRSFSSMDYVKRIFRKK